MSGQNRNRFLYNDYLFVKNDKPINHRIWENTGTYWAEKTNIGHRTTKKRGTHKVYKSKLLSLIKEEERMKRLYLKNEINKLSNRFLAANFGTRRQYKQGPNGKIVEYDINEYDNYSPDLTNMLKKYYLHQEQIEHVKTISILNMRIKILKCNSVIIY